MSGQPIDRGVTELAGQSVDLARRGHTGELVAHPDAGAPATLSNDESGTLLVLTSYHGHSAGEATRPAGGAPHARADDRGRTALAAAASVQSAGTVLDARG